MKFFERIGLALKILKGEKLKKDLNSFFSSYFSVSTSDITAYSEVEWIYACINAIINAVSSVPVYIYRKSQEGSVLVEGEKVNKLIEKPNPHQTFREILELVVMWELIKGVAYIWQDDEEDFWVLPSSMVVPKDPSQFPPASYIYLTTERKEIPAEQLIVFRKVSPISPLDSVSPTQVALRRCNLEKAIIEHLQKFFENAATLITLWALKTPLSDEEYKEIARRFQSAYQNAKARYGGMFLDADIENRGSIQTPLDQTLIPEISDKNQEAICSAFGVPPAVVGVLKYSNYANAEQQKEMFWVDTVIPILRRIEDKITLFLGGDYYAEFDLMASPVVAQMEQKKMEAFLKCLQTKPPLLTINEIREELGYPKYPPEIGNRFYVGMTEIPEIIPTETEAQKPTETELAVAKLFKREKKQAFSSRRVLTKEERVKRWRFFDLSLSSQEKKFASVVKKQFAEQKKIVLENWQITGKGVKQAFEPFNLEEEIQRFRRALRPLYISFTRQASDRVAIDLGVPKIDILTVRVLGEIDRITGEKIRQINEFTIAQIKQAIKKGIEAGESHTQIEKRIADIFEEAMSFRTERIARTETLFINEFATFEAYKGSGMVEMKEWLATQDERVRDAHLEADGQVVPLDQPFIVGGEELMYPGDPSGSPENIINCRCDMLPVLREEL